MVEESADSKSGAKKKPSVQKDETEHKLTNGLVTQGYKFIAWLIRSTAIIAILLYIVVPVLVKTNPWIQTKIIFLNNLRWPPFVDFSQPEHLGLGTTRNFYIQSQSDIRLGAWHVLPVSFKDTHHASTTDFEALLKDSPKPIILYLHGNSGTRAGWHRVGLYKLLSQMDFHVLTIDYRGYGDSSGSPSEDGVVHDAYYFYKWLKERSGKTPVFLWGHSLGTGVTTKLARQLCKNGEEPEGIFLESGFNNILDAATYHPMATPFKIIPWFHWLFLDTITENDIHFESDRSIADVTPPLMILHAEDDLIVPHHLGVKLYEAAQSSRGEKHGPVEFVSFNASLRYGHKLIFMSPELPDIIRKFVNKSMEIKKLK